MNISQPEIAAAVAIGQSLVINTEQVQQCGVKIMHMHFIALGIESVIVARAVTETAFYSATSHPIGKRMRIVVAAVVPLCCGCTPEFSAPNHQGIVEHAAGF